MNKEIKIGDKVRVLKDAPRMYIGGIDFYFTKHVSVVKDIDNGSAALECEATHTVLAIPTKYLVKVEENPEIKVGDRVRIKPETAKTLRDLPEPYRNAIYEITSIIDGMAIAEGFGQQIYLPLLNYILIEPKERTEEERIHQMEAERDLFFKEELDRIEHPEKYATYEVEVNKSFINWTQYEAELAKEVAVKIANKYSDVEQVAKDAVKLAKSVVENLKKK